MRALIVVVAAAALAYGAWAVVVDPAIRVTVVNRTSRDCDGMVLLVDGEPRWALSLRPGESESLRLAPAPGRSRPGGESVVTLMIPSARGRDGAGVGAVRWARFEVSERPRDEAGHDRRLRVEFGTPWTARRALSAPTRGAGAFAASAQMTLASPRDPGQAVAPGR